MTGSSSDLKTSMCISWIILITINSIFMAQKPLKRGKPPVHPGTSFVKELLADWQLTITEGAALLEVSRKQLSEVVNGKAAISPDMAIRLEKVFMIQAETWLGMMNDYDLWQGRKSGRFDHLKPHSRRKSKTSAR